jgi:hypothetical protein
MNRRSRLARPLGRRDRLGRLCGCRKLLLTGEQIRIIRRAWKNGATRDEVAAAAGVSVGLIRQRLQDQLRDLPRPGRGHGARRPPRSDPSPEEIYGRLTIAEQAAWTDEERAARWHGTPAD